MSIINNRSLLEKIISESRTRKEVLEKLLMLSSGSNYKTLNKYIKKFDIPITHFKSQSDICKENRNKSKLKLDEIFVSNSQHSVTNNFLKVKLIKEYSVEEKCEICGLSNIWNSKKITLQLDHIDGIRRNNNIDNLRFLCPNCHSQTKTFAGKNKNGGKLIRSKSEKEFKEKEKKNNLKSLLMNSNIDFSKKTWGIECSKIMNFSPQYCLKYIKNNFPELLN